MTKDFVDALAARYVQAGDEQKASLLFGIEATPASSLSIFCCQLPEIDRNTIWRELRRSRLRRSLRVCSTFSRHSG
jgi:hypothetical protein